MFEMAVTDELRELALAIQQRNRGVIRDLRIEPVAGGVVLRGRAYCYYGKQIAQNEVLRKGDLRIVANRLEVDQPVQEDVHAG